MACRLAGALAVFAAYGAPAGLPAKKSEPLWKAQLREAELLRETQPKAKEEPLWKAQLKAGVRRPTPPPAARRPMPPPAARRPAAKPMGGALPLTLANFDSEVHRRKGRDAFVKFLAPW